MVFVKKTTLAACMASMLAVPGIGFAAQDELIEASALIRSDISNGLNEFGQIENVLLDENSKSVEYLFFQTSDTFTPTSDGKGFVSIDNVDFGPAALGEVEVIVEDTDAQRKPEELQVTRSEADYRLLSNVLDGSMQFSDDETHNIHDILINPDSGAIEYFTVSVETDSFFTQDIRAIPASDVEVSMDGQVTASVALADVKSDASYQLSSR